MRLECLAPTERARLAPERGEIWHGALSIAEFVGRNERLYAHPFARMRMRTFGFHDGNTIPVSMDALETRLIVADGKEVEEVTAWHIASVLTLPAYRKQGLATQMLEAYFAEIRPSWSTLFSGIGAQFYERFGFEESPVWEHVQPAHSHPAAPVLLETDLDVFVEAQRTEREKLVLSAERPCALFYPDALWWEWYSDIYQYIGETRGKSAKGWFGKIETAASETWCAAMENHATSTLEVWWASNLGTEVLECLAGVAHRAGLSKISWWSGQEKPAGSRKVAMLRSPLLPQLRLADVHAGDWW